MSDVNIYTFEADGIPGSYVDLSDYAALEAELRVAQGVNQQLLEALEFAAKSLATMTSADGSGHADVALCVLRMAGYAPDERERMVGAWKQSTQWRTDDAIAAARKEGGKV